MTSTDHANADLLPSRADLELWAAELGFAQLGITDVDLSAYDPHVRQWLQAGFAGEMGYLERNLEKRLNPALLEADTCRVISVRMDYLPDGEAPIRVLEDTSKAYISRYTLGRDYHKVLRKRLAKLAQRINDTLQTNQEPGYNFRAFTDSAPVLEKALGEKAGLGWIGKHTLLLNKQAGSWFFLGEIYTDAPFPLDAGHLDPAQNSSEDGCGKCSACITVCPTQAIVAPRTLDATRCISYLTIEHKTSIPKELRKPMGNRIFGCDDCQLFCPWNREGTRSPTFTSEPDFQVRHELDNVALLDLFCWSETEFLQHTEGSAMRRVGYDQWQRNLAVALGNGPATPEVIHALQTRLPTASSMVAEHIQWALEQLSTSA